MIDDDIIRTVAPFTLTSPERLRQTLHSIEYIVRNEIQGDIIEVGVWRGGTVMAMLMKLKQLGVTDRHVHLFDTFEGMTESGTNDNDPEGTNARLVLERVPFFKCIADIEDVKQNISQIGYPLECIHFHKGDIRHVDPRVIPAKIACLRLDIDWYELYKFCLPLFEPRVEPKGPITIDDYGYWSGCKIAVDEYLKGKTALIPIDDTGVYWYKEVGL